MFEGVTPENGLKLNGVLDSDWFDSWFHQLNPNGVGDWPKNAAGELNQFHAGVDWFQNGLKLLNGEKPAKASKPPKLLKLGAKFEPKPFPKLLLNPLPNPKPEPKPVLGLKPLNGVFQFHAWLKLGDHPWFHD